jgi:hypothetical protein
MTIKSIIKQYNIKIVWHFTDQSNLSLIEKHGGVLSLKELERKHITIPNPGGNSWSHDADKSKGLDKYVHLTFFADHPMFYKAKMEGRIKNPVCLKVDSSVLLNDGVHFSSDVSNKAGVEILDSRKAAAALDFEVLFTYMNWSDPVINARRQAALKSEILIPEIVPFDTILEYING